MKMQPLNPMKLDNEVSLCLSADWLEGEEEQESHHQAEQTHGLGQGEAQDGVRKQLLLQGGVPGIADDQASEHAADSSS